MNSMVLDIPEKAEPVKRRGVSFSEAVNAYETCGRSVWSAAKVLGVCGQRVHQILKAGGYQQHMNMRPWTEADDKNLREHYIEFRDRNETKLLAKAMNRTKSSLTTRAYILELTNYSHPAPWAKTPAGEMELFAQIHHTANDDEVGRMFGLSKSGVEKRRAALGLKKDRSKVWDINVHPRGMRGKTHTPEYRAELSANTKRMWADPNHIFNSAGHRQGLSDRSALLHASGKFGGQRYSRAKVGKRADLGGLYLRSSWEANYARYLNFLKAQGQIKDWQYEPDIFWFHEIKRGTRHYTPDFKIFEGNGHHYVEVKGWMDPKSKVKLARMAKFYPEEEVRLFAKAEYRSLASAMRRVLPHWEGP